MALNMIGLITSTRKFRPKSPKANKKFPALKIQKTRLAPLEKSQSLTFIARMKGSQGDIYRTTVKYFDVYVEKVSKKDELKKGYMKVKNAKGKYFAIKKPKRTDNVKVRCSCPDYFFSAIPWNYRVKCHYGGKMRRYRRKTSHYPPRNPKKLPMVCKHVEYFLTKLKDKNIIR